MMLASSIQPKREGTRTRKQRRGKNNRQRKGKIPKTKRGKKKERNKTEVYLLRTKWAFKSPPLRIKKSLK
jgi:hypothetical protein